MRFVAALLATSFFAVVPASAEDTAEWSRVSALSEKFSAEIPCTPSQVSYQRTLTPQGGGAATNALTNDPQNRVMCIMSRDEIYVATLQTMPDAVPAEGSLFDFYLAQFSQQLMDGEPKITQLDGRRAFVNREIAGAAMAESGIIEVGRDSILLYNTGNLASAGPARIDRFRASIRIGAQ